MDASRKRITVEVSVHAPIQKVWKIWTTPEHITQWNSASDDWHTPKAENDLKAGGKFLFRMESKDGSFGFDFDGVYEDVQFGKHIVYSIGDGRKVDITFSHDGGETKIVETFEAESQNSIELQRDGWQAILNNFKRYTEGRP